MRTGSDERYNLVVKANDLITKSRFSLSTQQQKIVLYLISKIDPFDTDFKVLEFSVKEFCNACGIDAQSGKHYEALKAHIKAISDKSIWVKLPNAKETLLRWIEKPYIDERNGTIQIKLDDDMKPFLLQLKKNFTQYELVFTLYFKSKYSIRLYEYVKAVHGNALKPLELVLSLDELRERMGAEKYTEFFDFHRRVLKSSVAEINRFSDKRLTYEVVKNGKKVGAIRFTIENKSTDEILTIYRAVEEKELHGQQTLFEALRVPKK